jgi:hypothetical protein
MAGTEGEPRARSTVGEPAEVLVEFAEVLTKFGERTSHDIEPLVIVLVSGVYHDLVELIAVVRHVFERRRTGEGVGLLSGGFHGAEGSK